MQKLTFIFCFLSLLLFNAAISQNREVTGKVTDQNQRPLSGVSVKVKNSNTVALTDNDGGYRINVPDRATLVFSYVGMKDFEAPAVNGITLNVTMSPGGSSELQEVVVTGYSSQTKKSSVGSVARIDAADVKKVPIGSFDQALQGQAPGVLVQAQSGQPGAAARINIRGKGSIVGSNDPLYILDGVQITANDFQSLNPNDFESISLLKDASSTAIYGSRGANGVIVITSNKGRAGRVNITYDGQYGLSTLPKNKLQVMNSTEKIDYELANGNPYGWTAAEADSLRKVNTNWYDVFFRRGKTQSHQLSLNGGADRTRYYISGSIFDQTGTVKETSLKRYTGRVNIETGFSDFKVGLNTYFGYSKLNNTIENSSFVGAPLNAVLWLNPYERPYTSTGTYSSIVSGQPHPLQELLENVNRNDQLKAIVNANIEWKIPFIAGVTARSNWGVDYTNDEFFNYTDRTTYQGTLATGGRGSLGRSLVRNTRFTGTTSLSYTKAFGDHSLTAGLYNEIIKTQGANFGFTGYGLLTPFENEAGITAGTPTNGFIPTVNGNKSVVSLLSYFADVNYGFKNRYFINANLRRDGSSRFGENKRWATFGSIGASWIVSDESFMESLRSTLSNLKLKVSYGSVGNQALTQAYPSLAQLVTARYGGVGGISISNFANPDLQWEIRKTLNTGIEFGLFKNRLNGSVEYYDSRTDELFLNKQISNTSGASTFLTNVGSLKNSGIEFGLRGDVIKTRDFTWGLNVSYTHNKNQILELVDGKTEDISGITIRKIGEPLNTYYLVRYAGVDPANGDALYLTKDGKLTNVYSPADRVSVGTADAPNFGGFGTDLNYKGLELNVFFSFVQGNKIYNNDKVNLENPGYLYDNINRALLTEWRTPGQITNIPSPLNDFQSATTRYIEDGSFMRLRNVNLSYSLPASALSKMHIRTLRFFVQAQNLITWSKYEGWDPELNSGTSTGARYPALRTITGGITVGF